MFVVKLDCCCVLLRAAALIVSLLHSWHVSSGAFLFAVTKT
eukprot:COSAG05_NODE_1589_length_4476_cov_118.433630_2_plen_41_part_00